MEPGETEPIDASQARWLRRDRDSSQGSPCHGRCRGGDTCRDRPPGRLPWGFCESLFRLGHLSNVPLGKYLIKKAQPFPHRRPGDQPKKVRTLPDNEVRKEAESVYRNYRPVMRKLAQ